MGMVWTFRFEGDGSMEQVTNIGGPLITMPGTWNTSTDQLTMTLTGPTGGQGQMAYQYSIDENILELIWSLPAGPDFVAEFTKQ